MSENLGYERGASGVKWASGLVPNAQDLRGSGSSGGGEGNKSTAVPDGAFFVSCSSRPGISDEQLPPLWPPQGKNRRPCVSAGCRIASRPSRKKHFVILPKAGELPSVPLQTLFPSLGLPFTTRMRGGGGGGIQFAGGTPHPAISACRLCLRNVR